MSQYRIGTADVTNLSAIVQGNGTLWLSNVVINDWFVVNGVIYTVGGIASDTQLSLTAPYGGITEAGVIYAAHRDFHPIGTGLMQENDVETAANFNDLAKRVALGENQGTAATKDFGILDDELPEAQFVTLKDSATGASQLPVGDISERPANGAGQTRFNSETGLMEVNNGTTWSGFGADGEQISKIRNGAMNQEPVSQGESSRAGMSSTKYTGTGAAQSIANGLDMDAGDFGGLVWIKDRDFAYDHTLVDTVRGVDKGLFSNTTSSELSNAYLPAFSATGFDVDTVNQTNVIGDEFISWSWQTNKKTSGLTNRNKAFTAHYNTDLGFSIVGYVGDGLAGHEIPHQLGVEPELSIFKNRDQADSWIVGGSVLGANEGLVLDTTAAVFNSDNINSQTLSSVFLDTLANYNAVSENFISYHFASVEGVSKIGTYIGTGAAGNYVDCGFKAGWVLIKNLNGTTNWTLIDTIRGDRELYPDGSDVEVVTQRLKQSEDGFVLDSTGAGGNADGDEYLFMAFAESSIDATKTLTNYNFPTTADTLTIDQDTQINFAEGFDATGQVDSKEIVGSSVTHVLGAGHESQNLWLYKDKGGNYDTTEFRPLVGVTRNTADKWGVVSPLDGSLRTADLHSNYESPTGVVSASGEDGALVAWKAFTQLNNQSSGDVWQVISLAGWLQYKQTEKRILKSWRLREDNDQTQTPDNFTIEGSSDGLNWTVIDSTYAVTDYDTVSVGASLWGPLQLTAGNTTAYLYHRINITANNGHGTITAIGKLEFNTLLPSDYFLVDEGVMYNAAGTPIERVYLAEIQTDAQGDVSWFENLPIGKANYNDLEVHGELRVFGSPIIESGKNSNGSYMKFADGTLMQSMSKGFSISPTSAASLYRDTLNIVFDFPVDFVGIPDGLNYTCNNGNNWVGRVIADSQGVTQLALWDVIAGATFVTIYGIAVGRWKKLEDNS